MLSYCEKPESVTTEMGGVPHVEGVNNELYAGVTVKRRQPKEKQLQIENPTEKQLDENSADSEDKDENLPLGWEKHEGEALVFVLVYEWCVTRARVCLPKRDCASRRRET